MCKWITEAKCPVNLEIFVHFFWLPKFDPNMFRTDAEFVALLQEISEWR